MLIGLAYDLRSKYLEMGFGELETAEFDREDTIDSIENALKQLGYQTDRIGNAYELMLRLVKKDKWDLVFNICEGMYGTGREAQVPAILDLYKIPYTFSDTVLMGLALHKGFTKSILRDAKIKTPDFLVINNLSELSNFNNFDITKSLSKAGLNYPVFIKPIAEGTGKGISPDSIANNNKEFLDTCQKVLLEHKQPILIESYLGGREFTVGIIGTGKQAKVLGTVEINLLKNAEKNVYSYINKERCEELVEYVFVSSKQDSLVAKAEQMALEAWQILGCRDAGRIDLRCDSLNTCPYFLEVNPLAGLHPEHSDLPIICNMLKIKYVDLIDMIVKSAISRIPEISRI